MPEDDALAAAEGGNPNWSSQVIKCLWGKFSAADETVILPRFIACHALTFLMTIVLTRCACLLQTNLN